MIPSVLNIAGRVPKSQLKAEDSVLEIIVYCSKLVPALPAFLNVSGGGALQQSLAGVGTL